jgi:hypothetical protein
MEKEKLGRKKNREGEKGVAVLAIVILCSILATVVVSGMLMDTAIELGRRNTEFALDWSEQTAIQAASPVRRAIDTAIYLKIQKELNAHLAAQAKAKAGGEAYYCQDFIDPERPMTLQYSICDPVSLLDGLKGAENRTIDELSVLKPEGISSVDFNKLLKTPEWQFIKRVSENRYKYTLKGVYIGEEVLKEPAFGEESLPGEVRVDRYRWLVQAKIETQTYDNVRYGLTVHYDVVTTVTTHNQTVQCETDDPALPTNYGFDDTAQKYVKYCPDGRALSKCSEPITCYADTNIDNCYTSRCITKNLNGEEVDNCEFQSMLSIGCSGAGMFNCDISPNAKFGGIRYKGTYSSTGCSSTNTGTLTNGYTWSTAIRIVGIGTGYD